MSKASNWVREHFTEFLISSVFLAGVLYAATTSWQNEQKLIAQSDELDQIRTVQSEQLSQVRNDLAQIKKTLINVLLDKSPNKSEIIKGLVSDTQTLRGIDTFKAGNFDAAYAMWTSSAQQGSTDSAFAIAAATSALKSQAADLSLPQEQRIKAQSALSRAPIVEIRDGVVHVQSGN